MMNFTAAEWNDFVSHLALDDRRKIMEKRRRTRHKRCVDTPALWQKVADAAAVEAGYQPAEKKVRVVKAAFATATLAVQRDETAASIQLLYDSFSQPATPGTRSLGRNTRQLLYRAEPYQLDVQIEALPEDNRLIISGQLLDVSHPDMVARQVQITLSNRQKNVVKLTTNQFGEFRTEMEDSGDLELSFLGKGGKPVLILLRGGLDPMSETQK